MAKKIFLTLVSFILAFSMLTFGSVAYADDTVTYSGDNAQDVVPSIQKDYFMGIFHKRVSDGNLLPDMTGEITEKKQDINYQLVTGANPGRVSLYDRFGGNISFARYLGEENVLTGFADKVYQYEISKKEEQPGIFGFFEKINSIGEILMEKDTYYTSVYYDGRPDLKNGGSDSRVTLYKELRGNTMLQDAELGISNYFLTLSKAITAITSFFISDDVLDLIRDVFDEIVGSEVYTSLAEGVKVILALAAAGLVVFVVVAAVKYFLKGNQSLMQLVLSFFGAMLSVGLIGVLLVSPNNFIDISYDVLKFTDNVTAKALAEGHSEDEIVYSEDLDNIQEAILWKQSVFLPWVNGVFGGKNYNELYTEYAFKNDTDGEKEKYKIEDGDASLSYGDINVPLGDGVYVKNWAALAYSCTSIYHIDAVRNDPSGADLKEFGAKDSWPKATYVSANKSIYADDFRWLDAYLKVGQYPSGSKKLATDGYVNAIPYKFDGLAGCRAFFMSILLLPLLVVGIKKFVSIIAALGNFIILLSRSLINVVNPNNAQYNILSNIKYTLKPFLSFLYYSIVIFMLINMYETLAPSDNPLVVILYLVLSLYLMVSTPENLRTHYDVVKENVSRSAMRTSDRFHQIREYDAREAVENMPSSVAEANARYKDRDQREEERKRLNKKIDEMRADEKKQGISSRRSGENAIRVETYEDVLSNPKIKNNREYQRIYTKLHHDLIRSKTNGEILYVLLEHRKRYAKLDQRLGIANVNDPVSNEYDNRTMRNKLYDEEKARQSEIEERAIKGNYGIYESRQQLNNKEIQAIKDGYGEGYEKVKEKYNYDKYRNTFKSKGKSDEEADIKAKSEMLKQARKSVKKNSRDIKLEGAQKALNELTGNLKGGSVVSLKIKLYALLGVVILFVVGLLLFMIFGF